MRIATVPQGVGGAEVFGKLQVVRECDDNGENRLDGDTSDQCRKPNPRAFIALCCDGEN